MNTKISTHSNSKIAEYLNEQLAMENAIADRLVPRIHETSIPDLKQHLEQNLRETMARQERMYQLITNLGGKPTDSKTDLPHLNQSYKNTIEELKNRVQSLTIDHDKDTKSAENEMHKIKEDEIQRAQKKTKVKIKKKTRHSRQKGFTYHNPLLNSPSSLFHARAPKCQYIHLQQIRNPRNQKYEK